MASSSTPPAEFTAPQFVDWFRSVAPYINAFRGRTFVVAFGGEVVADGKFIGFVAKKFPTFVGRKPAEGESVSSRLEDLLAIVTRKFEADPILLGACGGRYSSLDF